MLPPPRKAELSRRNQIRIICRSRMFPPNPAVGATSLSVQREEAESQDAEAVEADYFSPPMRKCYCRTPRVFCGIDGRKPDNGTTRLYFQRQNFPQKLDASGRNAVSPNVYIPLSRKCSVLSCSQILLYKLDRIARFGSWT